ncbi:radical SAM superfamily enzyme YgiQ (UPF0313 family) [Fontibacillus solani]|uniref:Radical SAM superfamily enzyme YgiQ (UPF0313 family) n=1 Tax=Fontibacillus solani TaxID=1572857 RepID=A0A7W3XSS7_9BACL|nr:radical SAM protein [Fontibacillus solani]MBA9086869.1 radical SAM superfamily enzyme YgiQ (UPF0313 family) [Fontibacillus solani]
MICLISPPTFTVDPDTYEAPLGIGYLASILIENKYYVSCLDYGIKSMSEAIIELKDFIIKNRPKIVGITSVSSTYECARELLSIVKKIDPNILTIHGGIHVTISQKEVAQDHLNDADVLVLGEGEETLLEIMNCYVQDKELLGIRGLAVKQNGKYLFSARRALTMNIDSLPAPARHLFNYSNTSVMRVLTSRGCPYNCSFCASSSFWGQKVRFHSINRVLEEINIIVNQYGCKDILIVDDTFTINQNRAIEILNQLNYKDVNFSCLSRVNNISEELFIAMAKANVKTISFGCESANQQILDKIRKGTTPYQIRKAIRLAKKYNIQIRTSWIWGFPFDTLESLEDSVKLILEEEPDEAIIYRFVPYPGSEVYNQFPELRMINPREFLSGSEKFFIPANGLNIEEMELHFREALNTLYSSGYNPTKKSSSDKSKIATSGFTKFTSFWPDQNKKNHE